MARNSSETSSIDVIKRRRKRRKKIMVRVGVSLLSVLLLASLTALAFLGLSWKTLKEKNDTYKANYAQQNQEMGELKTKVAEANNLLADLQEQIGELQAEKDALEKDVNDLKAENADLKEKMEKTSTSTGNGGGTSSNTDEPTRKVAYLTFDDGCSKNTGDILDTLDRYGVKATFFVNWKPAYKDAYKQIVERGHTLGNHTLTHEWDTVYSTIDGFVDEVEQLQTKVYELTGYKMTLFRFPGGTSNTINRNYNKEKNFCELAAKEITKMGMIYFDWNIDSGDASSTWKNDTAEDVAKRVLSQAKNKKTAVILMHDVSTKKATREALPAIIEGLLEMGFEIEALSSESPTVQFAPAARKS